MPVLTRPMLRAVGLTVAIAAVAGAQQKSCDVSESRPTQIGKATLAVQIASSQTNPQAAQKQLQSAVKLLTDNGEKLDNQVGRNLVLGKALVLWSTQPDMPLVTKRGPLGFTASPDATIDLVAAIDSAFKVVETANPECAVETSKWRGQKAWIGLVNGAIERLNADEVDSAESLARKAITMNPMAPYGFVVLGNVMQKKSNTSEAISLYQKSIDVAGRDTAYNEIRRQSLLYLGNIAADSAEVAADAATRAPYIAKARNAFETLLADKGAGDMAAGARQGLCRVSVASGDTASLRTTYREPLTSPAGYAYVDLMSAGVCLARAEMVPEATTLFQAAYDKNPYHRDALSNLAIMLLRQDQEAKALPLAQRLVAVEPNNPENIQLLMLSYAGIAKKARDARVGTRATRTGAKTGAKQASATTAPKLSAAATDSLFRLEKAFTDSAVSTNERKEKLAFKVQLSNFQTNAEQATVSGSVTNQGTEEKSLTVRVEFLDAAGKVVQSKDATVGPLAAHRSGRFSVTVTPGKEITAFRYSIS
ncbi:MAG TPA: FxLYD domain-containing protein [Gemmatimonadaceae bacterium]|nr:FxLYD domain-containing protein [Gemmatimonadaceae bacterium]